MQRQGEDAQNNMQLTGNDAQENVQLVRELMLSFTQDELLPMTRELYNKLMGIPDPFAHLDRYINAITSEPEENPWIQEILFAADMDLAGIEDFLLREKEMICAMTPPTCEDAAQQDEQILRALLEKLHQAQPPLTVQEKIDAILAAKKAMPGTKVTTSDIEVKAWYKDFQKLRSDIKNANGILDKTAKNLQRLLDASAQRDNLKIQRLLRGMSILLRAISEQFRQLKLAEAGIDYADMEQMAYELMQRSDIREAVTDTITDIYVDECQDVSAIQYAIIGALTGGEGHSICRVGDIKQSIYGFRSAAPDLMQRDIAAYDISPDATHRKIFFQENYRSCAQVIDCINQVFDASMEKSISQSDYTPEDHLHANVDGDFGPVEVILLAQDAANLAPVQGDAPVAHEGVAGAHEGVAEAHEGVAEAHEGMAGAQLQGGKIDMLEAQCNAAGRRIEDLISSGAYDYKDIVILVRSARTDAPKMADHFRRMHIPVLYDGGLTFYGLTEISSLLCLLSVIDNDHTDVELVGALRGVPFSFSDADLARIREAKMGYSWFYEAFGECCRRGETKLDKRCIAARDRIRAWREHSRTVRVSDFIWQLMRESGIYAVRGAYPDGKLRQRNLDTLYQRAVDMEKRGVTRLSDFLREIGKLREAKTGDSDTPAAMGEGDNFVRLMTMHKSKGLEFPVVILMNLQKDLRRSRSDTRMRLDIGTEDTASRPLGVYVPAVSRKKHTRRNTYGLEAFKIRSIRSEIAESTRLLYVAMTRAMQKLILIGQFREKDTDLWSVKTKVGRIWKTRSMLDLVMPAVLAHTQLPVPGSEVTAGGWQLSVQVPTAIQGAEERISASRLDQAISALLSTGGVMGTGPVVPGYVTSDAMGTDAMGTGPVVPNYVTSYTIRMDSLESTSPNAASPKATPSARLMWPDTTQAGVPLKTSVTSLLRSGIPATSPEYTPHEEEETVEIKRRDRIPGFLLSEIAPRPAFLEETKASASDIGSLTHRFLRLIDLAPFRELAGQGTNSATVPPDSTGKAENTSGAEKAENTLHAEKAEASPASDTADARTLALVTDQLARMRESSILTESEADAIYTRGAAAFLGSSLGRRLIQAETLHREWPFTMQIREDSPTMVQGIVDAAFLEDGEWILIDYKTDRDTRPEIFIPRHEKQMNWYRTAVERLTQHPVREMWLFALRAGKAYPVKRIDV